MQEGAESISQGERFLELARTLPKVGINDARVVRTLQAKSAGDENARRAAESEFSLFGNNFWIVFYALRQKRLGPNTQDPFTQIYLEKAEALGDVWTKFLLENKGLIEELDTVVGTHKSVQDLSGYYNRAPQKIKESIDKEINHPLGLSSIAYASYDRMNPLLQRAWSAMETPSVDLTSLTT